jgi:hypothetical protein
MEISKELRNGFEFIEIAISRRSKVEVARR